MKTNSQNEDRVLATIEGGDIILHSDGVIRFMGNFDIDGDGGPNIDHDPCWQPDTSLHHNGKPINSQTVPYVVIPLGILEKVGPIGLGCMCIITNTITKKSANAVLADLGPSRKDGEGSAELARRIGLSGNARTGGEDRRIILYEIHIGVPALIDGVEYKLQPLYG